MRRLFWIALGAGVGVYAVRQVRQAAERVAPPAIAGSVVGWARAFADDVRGAMAERESELRSALGLDGSGSGTGP